MSDLYRLVSKSWQPPGTRGRISRGTVFTPPDGQIDRLLRIGAIVPLDDEAESDDPETGSDPLADDPASGDQAIASDPDGEGDATAATDTAETSQAPEGHTDALERPKQAAAKAVWVEYAVSRGMDRDAAEDLDKRELIAALS